VTLRGITVWPVSSGGLATLDWRTDRVGLVAGPGHVMASRSIGDRLPQSGLLIGHPLRALAGGLSGSIVGR
jgi:hypothetical protein